MIIETNFGRLAFCIAFHLINSCIVDGSLLPKLVTRTKLQHSKEMFMEMYTFQHFRSQAFMFSIFCNNCQ
jgi:hypothetical protein